jgi:formylglycine-generating enzyme required for sulfatase activity
VGICCTGKHKDAILIMPQDKFDCDDNYDDLAPVGKFEANSFGLFDMIGNVQEWCEDVFSWHYKDIPADGTAFVRTTDSNERVRRGGSWSSGVNEGLGSSSRGSAPATATYVFGVGFGLVTMPRTQ